MDPPQPQSISNAVSLLRKIGACHPSDHVLTPLGQHLASLPVNVKIGKMLIYGAILGCLEPIVCLVITQTTTFPWRLIADLFQATIAAAITEKSPFSTPMNRKEEANLAKATLSLANSDHLTIYSAYLGYRLWKALHSEPHAYFGSWTDFNTQLISCLCFFLPGGRRPKLEVPGRTCPTAGSTSSAGRLCSPSRSDPTVTLAIPLLSALTSGVSLPGREARADEDDGAGGLPVLPLLLLLLLRGEVPAGRPEGGADGGAVRQRGTRSLHPVGGRAGASGVHSGDPPGPGPGPPVLRQPQPADVRLAAVPGEGGEGDVSGGGLAPVPSVVINCPPQVKYTKIYLRDTTLIPPFPMLLFGGDIDVQHRERLITLDGWIHFQVRGRGSSPGAGEIDLTR